MMDTNKIAGLSSEEASFRLKKYGRNELPDREKRNTLKIIAGIITEPMILLLIVTVIIYFFIGDKSEAALLLVSIFGIVSVNLYQDIRTEKSLKALKDMFSPTALVIRDGKNITISSRDIVVGDIIILSEGIRVPADAKIIESDSLMIDESLLTGESVAVNKTANSPDDYKKSTAYSGTMIVRGSAVAEVVFIGENTEVGKIGLSLKSINLEKTLLQKEVNKVVKVIAILAILASISLIFIHWLKEGDIAQGILSGLTLAMAILPEELPVVLTVFLAMGAWRLAKNNVLARKAHTIETLGGASVLCVDKTGTLTENRMTILGVVNGDGLIINDDFSRAKDLIKYGVLASQKEPFDPMEEAILDTGRKVFGSLVSVYDNDSVSKTYPLNENELSMVNVWGDGKTSRIALKGAPEAVFNLCGMNKIDREKFEDKVDQLASSGLRVIAVAKGHSNDSLPERREEIKYEFLGLIGLADPVRRGVKTAIETCKNAGIRVIMMTGDYKETAMNIAGEVGLDCNNTITGDEFEKLSVKDKEELIKKVTIFSRVTPSHKLAIVNSLKSSGEIVAMTGDGVNDAPALKAAHIGIAMGKRGTDVARESASIVLLDDNFISIVKGVRLGRRIYSNLRKAMSYIISIHLPIATLSLLPPLLGWPTALMPAHIVLLELIIDPSCTLIFENMRESNGIMNRPPRKLKTPIFSKKMILGSVLQGIAVSIVIVVLYKTLIGLGWQDGTVRAMAFLVLISSNLSVVIFKAGIRNSMRIFLGENRAMLIIMSVSVGMLVVVYGLPAANDLFSFNHLAISEILAGVALGVISVLLTYPITRMLDDSTITTE